MRRRQRASSDSLELLLDTICNTFGGILFIAILVIIMLQMSSERSVSNETVTSEVIVQHQQLTTRSSHLKQELSRLQETLASQKQTLDLMAPAETAQLLDKRTQNEKRLERNLSKQDQLQVKIETSRTQAEQVESNMENAQRSLTQTESTVKALKQKLEEEQEKRLTEMNTTLLRSNSNKKQIVVVIQYDRFYIWHRYSPSGRRMGLNTDDFVVLGNDDLHFLETTPNPTAGTPLTDSPQTTAEIRRRLQHFSAQEDYFAVIVRPDSFDTFRIFRDSTISMGFEYQLEPSTNERSFVDRGGEGGRVQ